MTDRVEIGASFSTWEVAEILGIEKKGAHQFINSGYGDLVKARMLEQGRKAIEQIHEQALQDASEAQMAVDKDF